MPWVIKWLIGHCRTWYSVLRPADCSAAMGISHQLKNRADDANQLRCYTALLGLESRLSMAMQGTGSLDRDHSSLKETFFECQALNPT